MRQRLSLEAGAVGRRRRINGSLHLSRPRGRKAVARAEQPSGSLAYALGELSLHDLRKMEGCGTCDAAAMLCCPRIRQAMTTAETLANPIGTYSRASKIAHIDARIVLQICETTRTHIIQWLDLFHQWSLMHGISLAAVAICGRCFLLRALRVSSLLPGVRLRSSG